MIEQVKPLIDFTPDSKRNENKQINKPLTLEEALEEGILVSGLEVMTRAAIADSCYVEPWEKEIGNVKDNDVMYANAQVAIDYPELSKYVTNTVGLFAGRKDESIDISKHDFSNVWNTDSMFKDCHNVISINLGNNTFPKNTDAAHMFENCYVVRKIKGIENLEVSKVTSLNSCFKNCENIARLDLKNWCTPFLEDISNCWYDCSNLSYLTVDNFDTSICKNLDNVVGGRTLVQLRNVKKDLIAMSQNKNISRELREDDSIYYQTQKSLIDRQQGLEQIKMEKYQDSPMLLALALKIVKKIEEIDVNEQEDILNSLYLSKEDFCLLQKHFSNEIVGTTDVKYKSLNEIAEDIEEERESCPIR